MKAVQTFQLATLAKVMSKETAAEEIATMFQRSPHEELLRLMKEAEAELENTDGMFADTSGDVGGMVGPEAIPAAEGEAAPTAPVT